MTAFTEIELHDKLRDFSASRRNYKVLRQTSFIRLKTGFTVKNGLAEFALRTHF